jgi:rare lipoprotein A
MRHTKVNFFKANVVLLYALVISGCNADLSEQNQGSKSKVESGSASSKPVKKQVGEASWYGPGFHGKETASGKTYNQKELTAAHPTLPMGTKAKVTNLDNNKKVEVIINDRGPYANGRVIDLSGAAANKIGMKKEGAVQVKIETKPTGKKASADLPKKGK